MRSVTIKAKNLREGDVFDGQRVNYSPVNHFENVNVLLIKPCGYKLEHLVFHAETKLVVKRPIYNQKPRKAKAKPAVATPTAVAVDAVMAELGN